MKIGKLPNDILEKLVLNKIQENRSEVIIRPKTGMDCAAVDFGNYACVLSSDPITGTSKEIGRLAVHICCNDIASCGVDPLGIMATILCPSDATEEELEHIMDQLTAAAASINVDLLGGHTEVTSAVTRFVISCTALGRCLKEKLIVTSGAKAGDDLVITKHAGLEGASIIAHEKELELTGLIGKQAVEEAKSYMNCISVVRDGIEAAKYGVNAMHDVTEGGILGAVWEICEASGNGAEVFLEDIPIKSVTKKICQHYNINPYKLISSGCMLISATDGKGLVSHLEKAGISAALFGKLNLSGDRIVISKEGKERITAPGADELYSVL
ncbi:MAG: AIR synthase [Clostridiaceae bacterium]|jgi:hydrogenase maturation factor|nr:AIR synthase [Clostridiaceae bacterium]